MRNNHPLSVEQQLISDIFEPLTHIGHLGTPPKPMRSDKHFTKKPRRPIVFGLQDDAALALLPENKELVISKDMIVEGVHFIGNENPGDIAKKALRTNLSDLAAKGAIPYGYMLGLVLPKRFDKNWLEHFSSGLAQDQKNYTLPLLGGDLVSTPGPLTVSITILGLCDPGAYVSREEAQTGDFIYVSGTIGDACLGLKITQNMYGISHEEEDWISDLSAEEAEYFINRYHLPQPRNQIALQIAQFCTSSMDISDGLMGDTISLCRASNTGSVIDISKIPLAQPAKRLAEKYPFLINRLMTGGDDYEILCTVPKNLSNAFEQACQHQNIEVSKIGTIEEGECRFLGEDGAQTPLFDTGYSHVE